MEKERVFLDISLDKIFRKCEKMLRYLERKTKNTFEGYIILKMLIIFFEEVLGIQITKEQEESLRQLSRNMGSSIRERTNTEARRS